MLAVAVSARAFTADPRIEVTLSPRLRTSPLPGTPAGVADRWTPRRNDWGSIRFHVPIDASVDVTEARNACALGTAFCRFCESFYSGKRPYSLKPEERRPRICQSTLGKAAGGK